MKAARRFDTESCWKLRATDTSESEELLERLYSAPLLHWELGRELAELPGRLECRLPWLLHASVEVVRQQLYSLGARFTVRLLVGEGSTCWPPELTRILTERLEGVEVITPPPDKDPEVCPLVLAPPRR